MSKLKRWLAGLGVGVALFALPGIPYAKFSQNYHSVPQRQVQATELVQEVWPRMSTDGVIDRKEYEELSQICQAVPDHLMAYPKRWMWQDETEIEHKCRMMGAKFSDLDQTLYYAFSPRQIARSENMGGDNVSYTQHVQVEGVDLQPSDELGLGKRIEGMLKDYNGFVSSPEFREALKPQSYPAYATKAIGGLVLAATIFYRD